MPYCQSDSGTVPWWSSSVGFNIPLWNSAYAYAGLWQAAVVGLVLSLFRKKVFSLTYKVLATTQPSYLHNLITVQPPHSTRSSSLVTLARPSTSSSLRITDRYFQNAPLRLWNQPRLLSVNHALISPILTHPVLWVALLYRFQRLTTLIIHHPSLFYFGFKTFLFCKSFSP